MRVTTYLSNLTRYALYSQMLFAQPNNKTLIGSEWKRIHELKAIDSTSIGVFPLFHNIYQSQLRRIKLLCAILSFLDLPVVFYIQDTNHLIYYGYNLQTFCIDLFLITI